MHVRSNLMPTMSKKMTPKQLKKWKRVGPAQSTMAKNIMARQMHGKQAERFTLNGGKNKDDDVLEWE